MKGQPTNSKKIYLYARLSQEDEQAGDSNSIVNQRTVLTKYAEENGLTPNVIKLRSQSKSAERVGYLKIHSALFCATKT